VSDFFIDIVAVPPPPAVSKAADSTPEYHIRAAPNAYAGSLYFPQMPAFAKSPVAVLGHALCQQDCIRAGPKQNNACAAVLELKQFEKSAFGIDGSCEVQVEGSQHPPMRDSGCERIPLPVGLALSWAMVKMNGLPYPD
jgi:hypothetical protein